MKLYQHNIDAYKAVSYALKNRQRAAIVHATGTGKSYIIASVVEDYDKCLIVAPNNFVLNETRKICKDGVDFRTYASIMYDDKLRCDYDLIVLDEFHRAGAEEWGKGVLRLIESNTQSKLFGTSATHIRYLDNERNMADELFDGNIVSTLMLKDAITRGILPNPVYVSSLYEIDMCYNKYKKRIKESKLPDDKKSGLTRDLGNIADNWKNSFGVPYIIKKYFHKDMKRIIVFCSKVNRAADAKKNLYKWFSDAGYKNVRFYNIDYKEKRLDKEMEDFQNDVNEGELKVAISVNMLNEGVHIPRVDGIIMLRSTVSRIIIEQQIGRCLTANNNGIRPVVLDLVNNIDLVGTTKYTFNDPDYTERCSFMIREKEEFPFKIIDECRDVVLFFKKLDEELSRPDWESTVKELDAFYNEYGKLPTYSTNKSLYTRMMHYRRKGNKDCAKWLEEHGYNAKVFFLGEIKDRIPAIKEVLDKLGFIPTKRRMLEGRVSKKDLNTYLHNCKYVKRFGTDKDREELQSIISFYKESTSINENMMKDAIRQIEETGFVHSGSRVYRYWKDRIRLGLITKEEMEFINSHNVYGRQHKLSRRDVKLKEFIDNNKRLPRHSERPDLYQRLMDIKRSRYRSNCQEKHELFQLIKQYTLKNEK